MIRLVRMTFQRAHGIVFIGDGLRIQFGCGNRLVVVGVGQIVAFREDYPTATADARERRLPFRLARL